jgi:hypothetical protein
MQGAEQQPAKADGSHGSAGRYPLPIPYFSGFFSGAAISCPS